VITEIQTPSEIVIGEDEYKPLDEYKVLLDLA